MFKWKKSLDVVTLFHKKSSPASQGVLKLLQQTNTSASEQAASISTSDKAGESPKIAEFELDVVEDAPTSDQLSSILEYVGSSNAGKLIQGASDTTNALKIFKSDTQSFQRPVTVTWETGKAVIGDNQSEILRLIAALPKNN